MIIYLVSWHMPDGEEWNDRYFATKAEAMAKAREIQRDPEYMETEDQLEGLLHVVRYRQPWPG